MSQLAEVPSAHTLQCKIENVPGGLVDNMTDELLSLGALSARLVSQLSADFMPACPALSFSSRIMW